MAKWKSDEVEYGDEGISDDLLNKIGEVSKNQYGNNVTDSQMVQFGRELDEQQLDALDIGLDEHPEQIGGDMPLFEFGFQKTGLPKQWSGESTKISHHTKPEVWPNKEWQCGKRSHGGFSRVRWSWFSFCHLLIATSTMKQT